MRRYLWIPMLGLLLWGRSKASSGPSEMPVP